LKSIGHLGGSAYEFKFCDTVFTFNKHQDLDLGYCQLGTSLTHSLPAYTPTQNEFLHSKYVAMYKYELGFYWVPSVMFSS